MFDLELLFNSVTCLMIVYGIVLLVKNHKHRTNYLLAIWLLSTSFFLLLKLSNWEIPLAFSHCVFLYLYIKYIINDERFKVKDIAHFTPTVLMSITVIAFPTVIPLNYLYFISLNVLYVTLYLIMSYRVVDKYKKTIVNKTINNSINVGWLSFLIFVTALGYLVSTGPYFVFYITGYRISLYLIYFLQLILMVLIGLKAIKLDLVFPAKGKVMVVIDKMTGTYVTLNLNNDLIETIQQKLTDVMIGKQLFLNTQLTIKDLSAEINVPIHHISYVLNHTMNTNFLDFINMYRLEKVKNDLVDMQYAHFSIIAIAKECGFNSQATFNRLFKNDVEMSPSEYRKSKL